MRIQVRYFAAAREATGLESEALELAEGATVGDAFAALVDRHGALEPLRSQLRFALEAEFATETDALPGGATLALIPPVGGG